MFSNDPNLYGYRDIHPTAQMPFMGGMTFNPWQNFQRFLPPTQGFVQPFHVPQTMFYNLPYQPVQGFHPLMQQPLMQQPFIQQPYTVPFYGRQFDLPTFPPYRPFLY